MTRDEFFAEVERHLGQQAPGKTVSVSNRTDSRGRWLRGAGGGRFPGHGVIRYFSDTSIHVLLTNPVLHQTFTSPESALSTIIDKLAVSTVVDIDGES